MWNITQNPGHDCGINPKLKNRCHLPWHLIPTPPPGPRRTSAGVLLHSPAAQAPTGSFSVKWPAAVHLVLTLMDFTSLPACKIIQTSQAHHPLGTRGHPTIWLLQSLRPVASTGSFSSPGSSPVILWGLCIGTSRVREWQRGEFTESSFYDIYRRLGAGGDRNLETGWVQGKNKHKNLN